MDKTQIILFAAVMSYAGIRLYQKYIKKNKSGSGPSSKSSSESSFSASSKDDDYEPYSKK